MVFHEKRCNKSYYELGKIAINTGIFTIILNQESNKSLEWGKFPSEMKLADVTPVFKKENPTNKRITGQETYYQTCQKFERCFYNKLSVFFGKILWF